MRRCELSGEHYVGERPRYRGERGSQTGTGAAWDYSTKVGWITLTPNEVSAAHAKFNNPNGEAFTVTFNVIGNVREVQVVRHRELRPAAAVSGGSSGDTTTTNVTSTLYKMAYNPLLNAIAPLVSHRFCCGVKFSHPRTSPSPAGHSERLYFLLADRRGGEVLRHLLAHGHLELLKIKVTFESPSLWLCHPMRGKSQGLSIREGPAVNGWPLGR
jgi:hypothetical protein